MSTYYASRRMTRNTTASWSRNRNAIRHDSRLSLGPVSHITILAVLVLLTGLLFTSQSSKVTGYDLEIAETNSEISELQAYRDALAVENAKITALASDPDANDVALTMVEASSADFVSE